MVVEGDDGYDGVGGPDDEERQYHHDIKLSDMNKKLETGIAMNGAKL